MLKSILQIFCNGPLDNLNSIDASNLSHCYKRLNEGFKNNFAIFSALQHCFSLCLILEVLNNINLCFKYFSKLSFQKKTRHHFILLDSSKYPSHHVLLHSMIIVSIVFERGIRKENLNKEQILHAPCHAMPKHYQSIFKYP